MVTKLDEKGCVPVGEMLKFCTFCETLFFISFYIQYFYGHAVTCKLTFWGRLDVNILLYIIQYSVARVEIRLTIIFITVLLPTKSGHDKNKVMINIDEDNQIPNEIQYREKKKHCCTWSLNPGPPPCWDYDF